MNIYDGKLSIITAIIGTISTWLFGAWDLALVGLITLMVADYFLGIIKGYTLKELSSTKGFKGIAKKTGILIVLIVAVVLDRLMSNGDWVFRSLVCYFYIANESLSILENCSVIGLPVPQQIKNALKQLREGNK
ncbi:phage holin family protein [Clostridioides difficile]|uniref:phage holin family protein n=1 Tax=Clostridioides difficile TaxID=1496 RepID=UPI0021C94D9D|nr:phage holin family protein [Clostridioides difficile]UWD42713.1 phage holin family protein [Clostridioides difficile]